jgi:hypothetical protein
MLPLYDDRPGLLEWAAHGAVSVLWGEGTVVMKRSLLVLLSAFVLGVTAVGSVPAVASTDDPQVAVSQVQPADRDDDESKDDGKDNKDGKDEDRHKDGRDKDHGKDRDKDKDHGKDRDKDKDHGKDRDRDRDRDGRKCVGLIVICIG